MDENLSREICEDLIYVLLSIILAESIIFNIRIKYYIDNE